MLPTVWVKLSVDPTADELRILLGQALIIVEICRKNREPTSGLEPLTSFNRHRACPSGAGKFFNSLGRF
jgi:hypothetical protein